MNARFPARPHALNTLFDGLGDVVCPSSCDLVVLGGHLGERQLREAIARSVGRHPNLCRPLGGGAVDPALPIDLRWHRLPDDRARRVDAHLLGELWREPLDPAGRPVRFHVTETPTRTYLHTVHTHVFADATACYTLTGEIADAYADPAATPRPPVGPAPRLSDVTPARARLGHTLRGARQTARDLAAPAGGLALAARQTPGPRRLTRLCLEADETSQLRAAARARGASIHALFQLAFLRAARDFNGRRGVSHPGLRLWDFFSLRPLLERGAASYDCLALVYPVELDGRLGDDEVLARCTDSVRRMRDGELLDHAFRFDALMRLTPRAGFMPLWRALFKSNVVFTNPGVCPSPLWRFGDVPVLDYVTFPQLFAPADVMFIFSTFRDRLRVLVIHDEDAFGGALGPELLAPFLERLGSIAGVPLDPARAREGFVASWLPAPAVPLRRSA